jgi:predicted MFS family arabinose efflux permease
MRLGVYLSLLRENRAFARLYAAQLTSFAGEWFATVALLGLVLELTGLAGLAALVLVLQTGGFAAAAPIGGILADRLDRRRLLLAVNAARAPVALGFLLAREPDTLWIAFACVVLLAVGSAAFEPTATAALPNLVDRRRLPEANVLIGSAWGTMLAVGAALGGLVAVTLGRDAAFIINACAFALSAWMIAGIRQPLQQAVGSGGRQHAGVIESVRDAVAFARSRRIVTAFLLSKTTFGVGTGVVALLAVFGSTVFEAGDAGIGLLFAARGLGAVTGPFIGRAIFGTEDRGLLLGIGGSVATVALCYAIFPLAPTLWLAALLVFAAHCGGGAQWTLSTLGLQRASPDFIRGRLFSLDYGLVTLTITGSTLLAGALADALPPAFAVWTMVGLITVAGSGWIFFARPAWLESATVRTGSEAGDLGHPGPKRFD